MTPVILKGIPIPHSKRMGAASRKYAPTIRKMVKGDSVEIPVWDAHGFKGLAYKMGKQAVLRRISEDRAMVWVMGDLNGHAA